MEPPLPRVSALAKRALSALALAPPVLAAVWFGPPWSDILFVLAAGVLVWEWTRLTGGDGNYGFSLAIGVCGAVLGAAFGRYDYALAALVFGFVISYLPLSRIRSRPYRYEPQQSWTAAGVLYLAPPGLALVWLRDLPDGLSVVIWLLLVVWSVDIFAYVAGRTIGGPKLWPAVSPKKTWAGLIGGVVAAAIAGGALAYAEEGRDPLRLAILAAVLAVVAQGGDLLESAVKRRFGVKDASGIIPGHGGLLDRVDGLLTASLVLAAALWLALV